MTANSLENLTLWLWDNKTQGLHMNLTTNYGLQSRKDWFFSFAGEQTKNSWRAYNRSQPEPFKPWFIEQKQKCMSEYEHLKTIGNVYISKQVRNTQTNGRVVTQGFCMLTIPFDKKRDPIFVLVMKDKEFLGTLTQDSLSKSQINKGCLGSFTWKEKVDPIAYEDPW